MPSTNDERAAVERVKPPEAMVKVANPILGLILRSPLHELVDEHLMLLHFRGRKTGRAYAVVVGHRTIDGRLGVLTNSLWRVNFRGGKEVEVTFKGERRRGYAELVENPEEVARVYANIIEEYGHEQAGRRLGIRIHVDRAPTREELRDVVRRSGLSLVSIDLDGAEATQISGRHRPVRKSMTKIVLSIGAPASYPCDHGGTEATGRGDSYGPGPSRCADRFSRE